MARSGMEDYWDRRASEDPFHYVDSREQLGAPDEEAFWRGGEQVVDRLLGDLGVSLHGHERVVEIGCGIGRLTRILADRAKSVEALDVSEVMLQRALRYNPALDNVRWVHGDGYTLDPLPDASFDACVSFVVFQHIPDPEITYGYVREMGRILRPGGWAAFQVSNNAQLHAIPAWLRRMRALRRLITRRGPRVQHPAWQGSAVDLARLAEAAGDGGLTIDRVENEGSLFCFVLARKPAPGPGPG